MPKKLDSRDGWIITADLAVPSNERAQLERSVTFSILESPRWRRAGLQVNWLEFKIDPKTGFLKIRLLCTKNISKKTVKAFFNSVVDVVGVFDLKIDEVKWTDGYHMEYYVDLPDEFGECALPPGVSELGGDHSYRLPYSDLIDGLWMPELDEEPPEEMLEQMARRRTRNKILANNRAVWEHHQTEGYQRNIKSARRNKTS